MFFADGLESPLTREFTLALGRELGDAGWARATYVNRHATNFVEDFITIADGTDDHLAQRHQPRRVRQRRVPQHDLPKRDYQALELESAYRFALELSVNGHWTVQLQNDGTFEGESASSPALPSLIGDYPEIYVAVAEFPDGPPRRLPAPQGPRVGQLQPRPRPLRPAGPGAALPVQLGPHLQPRRRGVPLSAQQIARNPGYARLPASQSIFFGARGSESFEGFHLVDLAATYSVPVWQSLPPWVKVEVLNALNNQKLIAGTPPSRPTTPVRRTRTVCR